VLMTQQSGQIVNKSGFIRAVIKDAGLRSDTCNVKAKAVQLHATKALGGRGGIAPTHS
jgi:hypothetical protein